MELNIKEMISIIKLSTIKFKREPNLNEFADFLEFRVANSNFIKIRKFLEEKKVIKIKEERGNKIISINYKKLDEEIPEIPIFKYYEQNFRVKHKGGFTYKS